MQDAVKLIASEQVAQRLGIGQVAYDQHGVGMDRFAMALLQIIEDNDAMAARQQIDDDVAADIAGTAGDKVATGHAGCGSPL